jgi:hypothetical protein
MSKKVDYYEVAFLLGVVFGLLIALSLVMLCQ